MARAPRMAVTRPLNRSRKGSSGLPRSEGIMGLCAAKARSRPGGLAAAAAAVAAGALICACRPQGASGRLRAGQIR